MWCHLQIFSYRIDLMSIDGPISPKQCYYEMDYSFYSFYWLDSIEIRLDHNSTYYRSLSRKNSDVKPCISHCDSQNLQYKTHLQFWPSHRRIFKMSLYYKTHLILETRRQFNLWKPLMYFVPGHVCIIGKLPRWTLHVYNLMLLLHYICYLEVILWWIRLHRLTPYTELHGI